MSALLRNVTNAIWHAFNGLYQEERGLVSKTKLKVLTANIATVLDLHGLEKGLDHFRSSINLSFDHFHHYLMQEVFASLPNSLSMAEIRNFEEKIEEICWLICRKKYAEANHTSLDEKHLYKLFRIFCLLSDFVVPENDHLGTEVLLNSSEAVLVIRQMMTAIGLEFENDKRVNHLSQNDLSFRFEQFLDLIDFPDNSNVIEYEESMQEAIDEMYQTYIKDNIKKGFLLRRGYLLPTFKEYWFVLQPCELSYYKNHNEKDLCGTIPLDPKYMVKPSITSGKPDKILKFSLSSGERSFEFATHDHRTRMQWIAALQLAITYSTGREGFQRDLISQRRKKREADRKRRKLEERTRSIHLKEVELAKSQLKQEQLARQAAEYQAKQFEELAREDSRRVAELEDMKTTLERLLEEETLAKRDEEIVRALQARVLSEEWEKREELEQLQSEQKIMLEQERQKRIEFEQRQKEKEKQLAEAQTMLQKLEEERKRLDLELKHARMKIIESETNKEDLEARMEAWQPLLKQSPRGVRRTLSFVVPSRERQSSEETRSKTFREKAAQDTN